MFSADLPYLKKPTFVKQNAETTSKVNSDDAPESSKGRLSHEDSISAPNQSFAQKDSVLNLIKEMTEDTNELSPEILDGLKEIAEEDILSGKSSFGDPSSKTPSPAPNELSLQNLGVRNKQQKTTDK